MRSFLWERGGGKFYANGLGHMSKMNDILKFGKKHLKIFFSRTDISMILKLAMEHYVLKLYKVYIKYVPELTLTYSTTISNLANNNNIFCTILGPDISGAFTGPLVLWF